MFFFYNGHPIVDKLEALFHQAFWRETAPTQETLIELCTSFLVLNCCPSIRSIFNQYFGQATGKKLSAVYYTLSKAKLARNDWGSFLVDLALKCSTVDLQRYPVIIVVDDTIIPKFGICFEDISRLFNHSAKKEPKYVNGHCFVTIQLLVPYISESGEVKYFSTPISHSVWTPEEATEQEVKQGAEKNSKPQSKGKIKMAFDRINELIKQIQIFNKNIKILVLCDSWYPKGAMRTLIENKNVSMIANVRHDTCLYDLPEVYKGKGRPSTRGEKIKISEISLTPVPDTDYSVAQFPAIARVFNYRTVSVLVTSCTRSGKEGPRRVYICTDPDAIKDISNLSFGGNADKFVALNSDFLPLALYSLRWKIETTYYEQKKFWGMQDYMLRTREGIDRIINLELLTYSLMGLLPRLDPDFEELSEMSIQERRFVLGQFLIKKGFFDTLLQEVQRGQSAENSTVIQKFLCEKRNNLKIIA